MAKIKFLENAYHKTRFCGITPQQKTMSITKENIVSLFDRINQYEKLLAEKDKPHAQFHPSLWKLLVETTVTFDEEAVTHNAYEYSIEKRWKDGEPSHKGVFPFSTEELLHGNYDEISSNFLFCGFLEATEIMIQSVLHGSLNRGYRSISILFKEPSYDNVTIFRLLGTHPTAQLHQCARFFSLEKMIPQKEFNVPGVYNTVFQKTEHHSFTIREENLVQ